MEEPQSSYNKQQVGKKDWCFEFLSNIRRLHEQKNCLIRSNAKMWNIYMELYELDIGQISTELYILLETGE